MTIPIESLQNLGSKSSRWLRDAGITTIADLEQIGSVAAYQLVKLRRPNASLNLLWAQANQTPNRVVVAENINGDFT